MTWLPLQGRQYTSGKNDVGVKPEVSRYLPYVDRRIIISSSLCAATPEPIALYSCHPMIQERLNKVSQYFWDELEQRWGLLGYSAYSELIENMDVLSRKRVNMFRS
jgi:hypothetical protein